MAARKYWSMSAKGPKAAEIMIYEQIGSGFFEDGIGAKDFARELKDLEFTVDVLTHPEPVSGPAELDPRKYGVIVESGYRRGLLLPDLEGVDTVDYQIQICRQKGGIGPNEPVKLYRFEVKRYQ